MQPKRSINKLLSYSESYTQLSSWIHTFKKENYLTRRQRAYQGIKKEVKRNIIPLSFTINNMIVGQKM